MQWRKFMMWEQPYCMWGLNLADQNVQFVDGIDPEYFINVAEILSGALESDKKSSAALAIRMTYGQSLETFFALLGAALQAPHCPLGWMLTYSNVDLRKLVERIGSGERFYTWADVELTWNGLSRYIHPLESFEDRQKAEKIIDAFAEFWALCAHDFTNPRFISEYNSLKHGLRAKPDGLSVMFGRLPEAPIIDSRSDYGTHFFRLKELAHRRTNFGAVEVRFAWDPKALIARIEGIAASINNVLCLLKQAVGTQAPTLRYLVPHDPESLLQSWNVSYLIESVEGGVPLEPDMIEPVTKEEILRDLMS